MLNASAEDKEETNVPIFYYRDAQDGYKAGTNYLSTGIGIKKFVHPKDLADSEKSYDVSRVVQKYAPDIRYAEILLNYAEALNEVEVLMRFLLGMARLCILSHVRQQL